ncbi:MAG TPA: hypothetical protein DEB39_09385 [Planctomycetaceae bacterium]|nr:hypothetical protein [Planctomycetaceae bacterium]
MKKCVHDIGEGTIRRIDWQDLIPVVFLAKIPRVAIGLRPLYLAMVGVLLTIAAGYLLNIAFAPETGSDSSGRIRRETGGERLSRLCEPINVLPLLTPARYDWSEEPSSNLRSIFHGGVFLPWNVFLSAAGDVWTWDIGPPGNASSAPGHVFSSRFSVPAVPSSIWFFFLMLLWGYLGTGISRVAAMRLTVRENESLSTLSAFMKQTSGSTFCSFLIPLIGMLCCYLPSLLLGLMSNVPVLDYLAGLLFPLGLLAGLLSVLLGVALVFGWPLMVAAVAVEGSDAFDAVSRMYSYVYQRPLHYLFYLACSACLGMVSFFFLSLFLDVAAGSAVLFFPQSIRDVAATGAPTFFVEPGLAGGIGARWIDANWIIAAWLGLFSLIKIAFVFTFFWGSAVAIYLLLRRSVDNAPLNEIYRAPTLLPDPLPMPVTTLATAQENG